MTASAMAAPLGSVMVPASVAVVFDRGCCWAVCLRAAAEEGDIVFSPWHPVTVTDGPLASLAAEVVPPIAAAHGATNQQIALAWQLQGSAHSLPIPGTTSLAHLRQNLDARYITLTDAEMKALDDVAIA